MACNLKSYTIDFKDAFFQGETIEHFHGADREVFLKINDSGISGKQGTVFRKLLIETPGCKNAAARWFQRISKLLIGAGYESASFDRSYFVKHVKGVCIGLIPLHVDDSRCRLSDSEFKLLSKLFADEKIELSYFHLCDYGKAYEFCGILYTETPDGVRMSQAPYIENKLVLLPKIQGRKDSDALTKKELEAYGSAVGKLIWILPTNPTYAYEITYLSRFRTSACVILYRRLNMLLHAVRAKPDVIFLPRMKLPLKMTIVCDASQGEQPPEATAVKLRDHGMTLIFLCEAAPPGVEAKAALLSSVSSGIKLVTHSSFDSEAIVGVSSVDIGLNMNEICGESIHGICPPRNQSVNRESWFSKLPNVELLSDSMSLVKVIKLGLSSQLSRRRSRDVEDLRLALLQQRLSAILHISGPTNPSDCGTKAYAKCKKSAQILQDILVSGRYQPVLSTEKLDTSDYIQAVHALIQMTEKPKPKTQLKWKKKS